MSRACCCQVEVEDASSSSNGGKSPSTRVLSAVFPENLVLPVLEIQEWNMIGVWTSTEDCTICRSELEDQCRYCVTERLENSVPLLRRKSGSSTQAGSGWSISHASGNTPQAERQTGGIQYTFRRPAATQGVDTLDNGRQADDDPSNMSFLYRDERFLPMDLASQAQEFVCPVVRGACHHLFHVHCLQAWYKKSSICPLCGVEWHAAAILPTNLKMKELQQILLGKGYSHHRTEYRTHPKHHNEFEKEEEQSGTKKHLKTKNQK